MLRTNQFGCDGVEVKGLPSGPCFKSKLDCNSSFYWFTKHIASKEGGGWGGEELGGERRRDVGS